MRSDSANESDAENVSRLLRLKPGLTTEALDALQDDIDRLRDSARLDLLRNIPVKQFMTGGRVSNLPTLSIGEVVELGARRLVSLEEVQAQDIPLYRSAIAVVLGERSMATDVIDERPNQIMSPPKQWKWTNVSVGEAESQLFNTLRTLKASPLFKKVRSRLVGDFWDVDWVRAPFEESLTMHQIAEVDFETLVKKRSFTPAKMMGVAEAIRRCLKNDETATKIPLSDVIDVTKLLVQFVQLVTHSKKLTPAQGKKLMKYVPGPLLQKVRELLRQPAIPFSILIKEVETLGIAKEVAQTIVPWIVTGLNGKEHTTLRTKTDTVWTVNIKEFNQLITEVVRLLPLSENTFSKEVKERFPFVPYKVMINAFKGKARFNAKKKEWIRIR